MDFEERLQRLNFLYSSKELEYSLDSRKPVDYYSLFYIEMKLALERYLIKDENRNENVKVFFDNLDIVLRYTNGSNISWIYYDIIYNNPNFIPKLIDHLDDIRFKHHVCVILVRICNVLDDIDKINALLNDDVINRLLDLRLPWTVSTYGILFHRLDESRRKDFLKKVLDKGIHIDFSYVDFGDLSDETVRFIKDNIILFAKVSSNMFSLREVIDNDGECLTILDNYYLNKPNELAHLVSDSLRISEYSDTIKEIMYYITLDIIKNEDATFTDVSWKLGGNFSSLMFIKDKVIKYGSERSIFLFPNNSFIVRPLLRKKFVDGNLDLFVEVVENEYADKANEEDMYYIYENIRDIDLVWKDVKLANVGILRKDNVIHWKKSLNPSDEALGFEPYRGDGRVLKAGDPILLDADAIYDLNKEEVLFNKYKYFDETFERRYCKEKGLSFRR